MTQANFEALVSAAAAAEDCETVIDGAGATSETHRPPPPLPSEDDPYYPPEAIVVPIDDTIDLADLNISIVYDREDSTKGCTNPKSSGGHAGNIKSRTNSDGHFSVASVAAKPPIIGLPGKVQTSGRFAVGRSGRRPPKIPIFPKKDGPAGSVVEGGEAGRKSPVPETEPGSPKVSCFGKVLSNREHRRLRQASPDPAPGRKRTGVCWAIFRCGTPSAMLEEEDEGSGAQGRFHSNDARMGHPETAVPAPGLGGVKRFSSGRRAASWGSEA